MDIDILAGIGRSYAPRALCLHSTCQSMSCQSEVVVHEVDEGAVKEVVGEVVKLKVAGQR